MSPRALREGFFLASASTLPGFVVRIENGGDDSPKHCCRVL